MNQSIFREKAVDRVSSPEQLNDYIHVTSPSVWIVMATVLILIVGMLVWSIFGTVEVQDGQGNVQEIHPITYVIN
jgi:hypothetical protein